MFSPTETKWVRRLVALPAPETPLLASIDDVVDAAGPRERSEREQRAVG